jgi:hypothetical protein
VLLYIYMVLFDLQMLIDIQTILKELEDP